LGDPGLSKSLSKLAAFGRLYRSSYKVVNLLKHSPSIAYSDQYFDCLGKTKIEIGIDRDPKLNRSLQRLSAQVHHVDRNPAHNDRANLVCVCAGCHLRLHRHHPKPTPGQLALKLKLPKVRRSRQKDRNFQLTLADLIDRLPYLPSRLDRQLELDLDDRSVFAILASDIGAKEAGDLRACMDSPTVTD
jgi:hypothetical protein